MFKQVLTLMGGLSGVAIATTAFGWLLHYTFSDEMAAKEEQDEVEVDDNND